MATTCNPLKCDECHKEYVKENDKTTSCIKLSLCYNCEPSIKYLKNYCKSNADFYDKEIKKYWRMETYIEITESAHCSKEYNFWNNEMGKCEGKLQNIKLEQFNEYSKNK